jgi:trypsin
LQKIILIVIVIMFVSRVAFLLLLLLASGSCTFPNDSSGPETRHFSAQSNVEETTATQQTWYSQLFDHHSNQQKEQDLHPKQEEEQGRIIGGSVSVTAAHKFFVRVDNNNQLYCGGTLFASDYVLTAAHCHTDKRSTVVNGYDASSWYSLKPDQRYRTIEKVIIHPMYNGNNYQNDIMILKLSSPVNDIPGLEVIPLNFDGSKPSNGADLMTMGLGMTATGGYSNVLQEVTVTAIDLTVCATKYANGGLSVPSDVMLCAAGSGKDSCSGDSGGPLILKNTGEQVGIVSWGVGCADKAYPGVYTRVSTYQEWIKANVCSGPNKSVDPPAWCPAVTIALNPIQNQCMDQIEPFRTNKINTCEKVQKRSYSSRRSICNRQFKARSACRETCAEWFPCVTEKSRASWAHHTEATPTRTQTSTEGTYGTLAPLLSWGQDKNKTSNSGLRGSN